MLQEGQTLWYVPADQRRAKFARAVTVAKVGRKWAEIGDGLRINVETLWADGGKYTSPGRCWPTKQEYESHIRREELWRDMRNRMPWSPPSSFTETDIINLRTRILEK